MKSIHLVDDHPVVGLGLRLALRDATEFYLSGISQDPDAAIAAIAESQPTVVVLDVVFDGVVRLDCIEAVKRVAPSTTVVCFSSLAARRWSKEAAAKGADDYLEKSADLGELIRLISATLRRAPVVRPVLSAGLRSIRAEGLDLTEREAEIAWRLATGAAVSQIAAELSISVNTVSVHQDNIRRKLGCSSAKELVALLASMGRDESRRGTR